MGIYKMSEASAKFELVYEKNQDETSRLLKKLKKTHNLDGV